MPTLPMLLSKKAFLEAIRIGEKMQTIRLWNFRDILAKQRSYIPGMGLTQITAVESFESAILTDADTIPDGFPSMAALQSELQTTHGIPRRLSMPGSMTNVVAVRETE